MSGLIQSFSGLAVDVLNLKPEQVRFEDIPHALAQKVRFAGHLREMGYSVAQHCVHGAEQIGGPARGDYTKEQLRLKLAFLLHELDEVYLPDIPAPIKPLLWIQDAKHGGTCAWETLGRVHLEVMLEAIGHSGLFDLIHSPEVKAMDRAMLCTEKRDLRMPEEDPQIIAQERERYRGEPVPNFKILRVWGPVEAKNEFRMLYFMLKELLER